jgi:hypothetical protein
MFSIAVTCRQQVGWRFNTAMTYAAGCIAFNAAIMYILQVS